MSTSWADYNNDGLLDLYVWSFSENNRRARFYRLTRAGHRLLEAERRDWEQTAAIIARFFEVKAKELA